VSLNGSTALFDDVVDGRFLLLTLFDPDPLLTAEDRELMGRIGMRAFRFSEAPAAVSCISDETGAYRAFFASHGLQALVVRPDRYMFGGAQSPDDMGALLCRLRRALELS
jgi:hypothetical protein